MPCEHGIFKILVPLPASTVIALEFLHIAIEFPQDACLPRYTDAAPRIIEAAPFRAMFNILFILFIFISYILNFSDIFDKVDTADIKFDNIVDSNGKSYEMNNSVYAKYSVSKDRILRKNAYQSMNGAYGKLNNTLTAIYMGNVNSFLYFCITVIAVLKDL